MWIQEYAKFRNITIALLDYLVWQWRKIKSVQHIYFCVSAVHTTVGENIPKREVVDPDI